MCTIYTNLSFKLLWYNIHSGNMSEIFYRNELWMIWWALRYSRHSGTRIPVHSQPPYLIFLLFSVCFCFVSQWNVISPASCFRLLICDPIQSHAQSPNRGGRGKQGGSDTYKKVFHVHLVQQQTKLFATILYSWCCIVLCHWGTEITKKRIPKEMQYPLWLVNWEKIVIIWNNMPQHLILFPLHTQCLLKKPTKQGKSKNFSRDIF